MKLEELRNIIKESYSENVMSDEFDFECVVDSLPMRNEEDILRLLPYVMSHSLYLIDRGEIGKLQVLEIAIRLFNGLSECPSMKSSAEKLRSLLSPPQRTCMARWFLFLKDLDYIDYADKDFEGCIKFWNEPKNR